VQISPSSNFRIMWDSCQAVFLIYIAFIGTCMPHQDFPTRTLWLKR
jgi:hypothetical protein